MTIIRRRTWQRAAVRNALKESNAFVSAQDLYSLMRGTAKEVGLATIYRTLATFASEGEADSVHYEGENLYRACTPDLHHHHLICRNCGNAVELVEKTIESWALAVASENGYTDSHHTLNVFGLCEECSLLNRQN